MTAAPNEADLPDVVVATASGVAEVAVLPSDDQAPPMPHRRAVATLIVLALMAFLFSTNETSVIGVISLVADDMDRSEAAVGLMTTVWAIVNMAFSIPAALLLRKLSRRWVLSGTALLLAVGIAMVASAQNFGWLLAGRGLGAVAHAAFWAIVTPTAAGLFGSAERGKSVARLLLGTSLAGIIGLPVFTVLAQNFGWRMPYWLLCASVVAIAVAVVVVMPSFRAEQGSAARGLIPSRPIFGRILVVCGLTVASVALTWTFLTPFATEVAGVSHSSVPTLLFVGGIAGFVAMFLVGRYLDRFPVRSVAIGLAILGSVWALMSLFGSVAWVLVPCVMAQSFGFAVLVAAMVNWAIRHAPGSTDIANGIYATVFGAGNAAGSLLGAVLLAAVGASWLPVASLLFVAGASVLVWTMRGVGVARRSGGTLR